MKIEQGIAENYISSVVDRQIPSLYREDYADFVSFVEKFYEFMEQPNKDHALRHSRKLLDYIDIDKTLDEFLDFYYEKYMSGLPKNPNVDKRFVVKHILDLYRRKGTEESIRLLFRLFYDEHIEIYYPSRDVLRVSDSKWKIGRYVEVSSIGNADLSSLLGKTVTGSQSRATALVEDYIRKRVNNLYLDVLYLQDIRGDFIGLDKITIGDEEYARILGSVTDIVSVNGIIPDQKTGTLFDLENVDGLGTGAKVFVSDLEIENPKTIEFSLSDGGFGYTTDSNTEILISNQLLFFGESIEDDFKPFDVVTSNSGIEATVVKAFDKTLAVYIANTDANSIFEIGTEISGFVIDTVTGKNSTASFEIGSLNDSLEVEIFTDVISNQSNTILSDSDYGMSGTGNLTSTFEESFVSSNLEIGEIDSLTLIDPGSEYNSDVYVAIRNDTIRSLDIYDTNAYLDKTNQYYDLLEKNDIVHQSNGFRGKIVDVTENLVKIKNMNLVRFDKTLDLSIEKFSNNTIEVLNSTKDLHSKMGENAEILSSLQIGENTIKAVKVFDSGFAYPENFEFNLRNSNNVIVATGTAKKTAVGSDSGKWVAKTGHINSTKRLHDNNYYQDYSYVIQSEISLKTYEKVLYDSVHPSGVNLFSNYHVINTVNTNIDFDNLIYVFDINFDFLADANDEIIFTESNDEIIVETYNTSNAVIIEVT